MWVMKQWNQRRQVAVSYIAQKLPGHLSALLGHRQTKLCFRSFVTYPKGLKMGSQSQQRYSHYWGENIWNNMQRVFICQTFRKQRNEAAVDKKCKYIAKLRGSVKLHGESPVSHSYECCSVAHGTKNVRLSGIKSPWSYTSHPHCVAGSVANF